MLKSETPWESKVYIIAELSANHGNDKSIALKSIEAAAQAGATAVKTQLFTAGSLGIPAADCSPRITDKDSPWFNQSLYELYDAASLPYEWYPDMIKCAEANNIDLFASVFDESSVELAVKLGFSIFKVSSFELIHLPLLRCIISHGRPTILSTGMASLSEICDAHALFRSASVDTCFLKCTSDYPSSLDDTHIFQMKLLADFLQASVGLSDHSLSNLPSVTAVALGGKVIEKHFVLNRSVKSPDNFFSLTAKEFSSLVDDIRNTEKILSKRTLPDGFINAEKHSLWERPSLYAASDLSAGTILQGNDIIIRRPGLGIPANQYDAVVGRTLAKDIGKYMPISNVDFG